MNYLAHLHLSDGSAHSLVGNLMGDFVRGRDRLKNLPPAIRRGVHLHRKVDAYTDSHPVVVRSVHRLAPRWKLFSGIIVDVFYDHLLAKRWRQYSDVSLTTFVGRAHWKLLRNIHHMPRCMRQAVYQLVWRDRLRGYATERGLWETLKSISSRVKSRMPRAALPLEDAMADLREHHDGLATDFEAFYPDLQAFAAKAQDDQRA